MGKQRQQKTKRKRKSEHDFQITEKDLEPRGKGKQRRPPRPQKKPKARGWKFTMIRNAVLTDPAIPPEDKGWYAMLGRFRNNKSNKAWPRIRALEVISGRKKQAVIEALQRLVARRLIEKEQQGRRHAYRFLEYEPGTIYIDDDALQIWEALK